MNPLRLLVLLVSLPLLLGGCGGDKKVHLELREGLMYIKGSDTLYTGEHSEFYENGQKKSEVNYKDGRVDGLSVYWYENGQKKLERNWKDDKQDGLWVVWYKNGQKQQEENYKEGKWDGLSVHWYENGQKRVEVNYKANKEDGLSVYWHENGQKKLEETYKDGEIISEKFFNTKGELVGEVFSSPQRSTNTNKNRQP